MSIDTLKDIKFSPNFLFTRASLVPFLPAWSVPKSKLFIPYQHKVQMESFERGIRDAVYRK